MVGINLFGFRKFELLRGEGEGPGGDGGGAGDAGGTVGFAEAGRGGADSAAPGVSGGLGVSGTAEGGQGQGGGYMSGSQGAISEAASQGGATGEQSMGVSPGEVDAQLGSGMNAFGPTIAGMQQGSVDYAMDQGVTAANFGSLNDASGAQAAEDAQAQADAEDASISFTPSIGDLEALSTSPGIETTAQTPSFDAAALDAMLDGPVSPEAATVDSLSVAQDPSEVTDISFNPAELAAATGTVDTGLTGDLEALGSSPFSVNSGGTPPNVNEIANIEAATGLYGPSTAFETMTGTNVGTDTLDAMYDSSLGTLPSSDSLYGTSLVTGKPTTAMSPIEAQAMTGGSMSTTNNTGMNLAQQTDNVEATNQAEAMDVLGAQIGAGNLTGNEDIDQVNIELAKKGVQIDTSGLPGLLGTGVNAVNKNYQLNQNQDILTQLAQGTGNDDATNTGILGTGIGAVKGVNTYTPAYNKQGQIVGSVATDAAGNAVGGGAGITTNVVGGLGAMDDVYSDAAGTNLYGDVNKAVGDFKDMVASSQSSDEGPPEDVTSVDANGCVIGAEFFDGQKCSPIGSTTGDATGGGTGGAYTPYSYQPGQGTMLRPDFSDMYTSNVNFTGINPNASNMNFLKPAVNPYGNFAGGGIVPMMRNNRYR